MKRNQILLLNSNYNYMIYLRSFNKLKNIREINKFKIKRLTMIHYKITKILILMILKILINRFLIIVLKIISYPIYILSKNRNFIIKILGNS